MKLQKETAIFGQLEIAAQAREQSHSEIDYSK
jgi:hypothetical protein